MDILHELFDIETMIWLFPIAFMFHDLEEIITVEGFMTKYKNKVPKTLLTRLTLVIKEKSDGKSERRTRQYDLSCPSAEAMKREPSGPRKPDR